VLEYLLEIRSLEAALVLTTENTKYVMNLNLLELGKRTNSYIKVSIRKLDKGLHTK